MSTIFRVSRGVEHQHTIEFEEVGLFALREDAEQRAATVRVEYKGLYDSAVARGDAPVMRPDSPNVATVEEIEVK